MENLIKIIKEGLINISKTKCVVLSWNDTLWIDDKGKELFSTRDKILKEVEDFVQKTLNNEYNGQFRESKSYHVASTVSKKIIEIKQEVTNEEIDTFRRNLFQQSSKTAHNVYADANIVVDQEGNDKECPIEITIYVPYTVGSTDGYYLNVYIG